MGKKINNRITWVGKVDWNIRKFHGNEYSTIKGTTYNPYLIQNDKIVFKAQI